jgi:hypothetical protein
MTGIIHNDDHHWMHVARIRCQSSLARITLAYAKPWYLALNCRPTHSPHYHQTLSDCKMFDPIFSLSIALSSTKVGDSSPANFLRHQYGLDAPSALYYELVQDETRNRCIVPKKTSDGRGAH